MIPVDQAPQDTRLSDALGQQYDRVTEFLNRNTNPAPNPTEIGRAALSSSFGGTNYFQSISDMVANRQQTEASNMRAQGDALGLLVKRNELLASQGHPTATALQDALKTIGFAGWDPRQQQTLLQQIEQDPEKMDENNALSMVMRHSQGVDFTPEPDLPSGYREAEGGLEFIPGGPADPSVAESLRAPTQAQAIGLTTLRLPDGATRTFDSRDPAIRTALAQGATEVTGANEGMPYTGQGTMRLPDGNMTMGRFNKGTGEYEVKTTDPTSGAEIWKPAPPGSTMVTESSVSNTKPTANQLATLQQQVVDDQNSLKNLNRFMGTIGDMRTGYRQLADQFTGLMTTVMGENNLTPDQFAALVMKGQLQTLLGQNRIAVVGGGVMTEYDAQRVLQAIVGAQGPGGIINPELVADNLAFLFDQKKNNYSARVTLYNNMVLQGQRVGDMLYTGLPLYDADEIDFEAGAEKPLWE